MREPAGDHTGVRGPRKTPWAIETGATCVMKRDPEPSTPIVPICGEPFWSEYRGRFRWAVATRYPDWDTRMTDPKYLVNLLFVPGRTASR